MKRLGKKDRRAFAAIRATLVMLQEDAFDERLGSHKLKGELAGLWACSAGYDLRIVFEIAKRDDAEVILLVSVGTHDEVYLQAIRRAG
jgi:mRNA interferase YafQ